MSLITLVLSSRQELTRAVLSCAGVMMATTEKPICQDIKLQHSDVHHSELSFPRQKKELRLLSNLSPSMMSPRKNYGESLTFMVRDYLRRQIHNPAA